MARQYLNDNAFIGFEADDPAAQRGASGDYLLFEVTAAGLVPSSFDGPTLTLDNVKDLHAWLTAYIERTES